MPWNWLDNQIDPVALEKAKKKDMTPHTIDNELESATFRSRSGKAGEIYETTTEACTCKAFLVNNKKQYPCKHMLRLAMELSYLDNEGLQYSEGDDDECAPDMITAYAKSLAEKKAIRSLTNLYLFLVKAKDYETANFNAYPQLEFEHLYSQTGKLVIRKKPNNNYKKVLNSVKAVLKSSFAAFAVDSIENDDFREAILDFVEIFQRKDKRMMNHTRHVLRNTKLDQRPVSSMSRKEAEAKGFRKIEEDFSREDYTGFIYAYRPYEEICCSKLSWDDPSDSKNQE